jgi:hypothetical protein
MVTAWKREVCATRTSTRSGMFEVFETSYLFRARARRPSSNGESWTSGPAPWLSRVESLELRASQRKTPSVRREQRSLRGDVGSSDLGPGQNEPLISRRSRCNPGDAFGVRTLLHAIAAASSGRVRRVDLTASSWARGGGKGWRPASADATRFIGHSIEVAFARPGSLARILEVTARSGAQAPGREAAWSTGIASSCGVPGEVQAACERSGRARVASGAVDAPGAIPAGDEPADLHDGRLGAGTGPLGGGSPGSALRGASMVGGPANPRRRGDWMAIQIAPTAARRHTPTRASGGARVPPRGGRRRGRATRTATSVSTPREEPSSSPRAPRALPNSKRPRSKQRLLQVPESLVVCRWKRRVSCHCLLAGGL